MKLTTQRLKEAREWQATEKRGGAARDETAAAEAINEWKMTTSLSETTLSAEREKDNQI